MKPLRQSPDFGTLIRDFFCERLLNQQNVSPHTLAAYRDTFRLLFEFLGKRRRRSPDLLVLNDIDAPSVLAFLRDLEKERGNCVRTRNSRLGAIRAFVRYASSRDPSALPLGRRVLAIPQKRFDRPLLGYLTRAEVEAILNALDRTTWSGRRDYALFMLMYNTGARVSEAIGLRRNDAHIGPTAFVHICGKGRKERSVPLWKPTANVLKQWLLEVNKEDQSPLFPNRHGQELSRSGVEDRLQRAVSSAATSCPTLRAKNVSPHTLRHTTAMSMLQAGVDVTLIALWLGHESTETTHQYVEADLEMKRRTLDRVDAPSTSRRRRKKSDALTAFLDGL
jgi:site-specific recombinase XerD